MEYYEHGNLRSFMTRNRRAFVNLFRSGQLNPDERESVLGQRVLSESTSDDGLVTFSTKDLIRWSKGVAAGMEFLALKHVRISYLSTVLPFNNIL